MMVVAWPWYGAVIFTKSVLVFAVQGIGATTPSRCISKGIASTTYYFGVLTILGIRGTGV